MRNADTAAEGERRVSMNPKSHTEKQKFKTVLERNTFFYNAAFEERWEAYISSITNLLLLLKREWLKDNFKSFFNHGDPDWEWIRGRLATHEKQ